MTEEAAPAYRGVIVIEWPKATRGAYSAMTGSLVSIFDAVSGKQITTATRTEIHAAADELVTASLTMFTGADGEPLLDGMPVMKDGEALTETFPFVVSEMRVRQ